MSNEDLHLNDELASAYLDDELDETERATAAADPHVMALVDSFAQVRAMLGDVGPGVASTKTAAIAAALAEFDVIHAASPAAAIATVTSLRSRRLRVYRVMTGVAAAAIVGVVAIASINSTGGGDATSSSATEIAAAAPTELPELKSADNATAAADAAAPSDAGLSTESAAVGLPAIDTPEALQQYAVSTDSARTTAAASSPAATDSAPQLADPAPAAGGTGFATVSCLTSDQVVLGSVFSLGRSAVAVRNTSTGALQTLDVADCQVLVESPAP